MPALSVTKTYQDGDILTEADLDNIRESVESFFNTTKIDSDNVQPGGIGASNLGIDDDEYIEFGTGNDGKIGVTAADVLVIQNVTSDKDIEFKINDGGVTRTPLSIDSANGRVKLGRDLDANSLKIVGLAEATANGEAVRYEQLTALVPPGTISAYGGSTAPAGYLLCDGSAVSRTTYAALFAVIAETAGEGDNSTTFNVPDFRGRFLRGWDNAQGRDPDASSRTAMNTGGNTGDNIFTLQTDQFAAHSHTADRINDGGGLTVNTAFTGGTNGSNSNVSTDSSGGNETRPKNASVNYIIKY